MSIRDIDPRFDMFDDNLGWVSKDYYNNLSRYKFGWISNNLFWTTADNIQYRFNEDLMKLYRYSIDNIYKAEAIPQRFFTFEEQLRHTVNIIIDECIEELIDNGTIRKAWSKYR